ncbi:MAG: hypothetical protein RL653_4035 [Pseudomonadota bacterium]|jgi:methyl-accepting chemotaxis protein
MSSRKVKTAPVVELPEVEEPQAAGAAEQEALLRSALEACRRAAQGDIEARVTGIIPGTLAGDLGNAINALLDMTDSYVRESSAALEHASRNQYFRRFIERGMKGSFRRGAGIINAAMDKMAEGERAMVAMRQNQLAMADGFEKSVMAVAQTVAAASTELEASARTLSSNASEAITRADATSAQAEEASNSTVMMAAAAEEMRASIGEIARQVGQASTISRSAVSAAESTNGAIAELQKRTESIGDIVRLINGIAGQTKLLALNAAIEAARAGESGRGFGVVAAEVKSLAGQTTSATDGVETQIQAVQQGTHKAAEATRGISVTISKVDEIAGAIASAMEEQKGATTEISRSIQAAASSTRQASENAAVIANVARTTGTAATEVLTASAELSKLAETLLSEVRTFLQNIRA